MHTYTLTPGYTFNNFYLEINAHLKIQISSVLIKPIKMYTRKSRKDSERRKVQEKETTINNSIIKNRSVYPVLLGSNRTKRVI